MRRRLFLLAISCAWSATVLTSDLHSCGWMLPLPPCAASRRRSSRRRSSWAALLGSPRGRWRHGGAQRRRTPPRAGAPRRRTPDSDGTPGPGQHRASDLRPLGGSFRGGRRRGVATSRRVAAARGGLAHRAAGTRVIRPFVW